MKQFGAVISCIILKEKGKSRGFGFVTFTSPDVAEEVCAVKHYLRGKEFGCNLIMPNKEARSQQVDKKNRKIYIKTKEKQPLIKAEVYKVFAKFGDIADITILKESRDRSGFITFYGKDATEYIMKAPEIPYMGGVIICEPCLSRKEIKRQQKPHSPGHEQSQAGDLSMVDTEYNYHDPYGSYQESYNEPYTPYAERYYEEYGNFTPLDQSIIKQTPSPGLGPKKKSKKESTELQIPKVYRDNHLGDENVIKEPKTWPAAVKAQVIPEYSPFNNPKPKYFIEVRDVSGGNNLNVLEFDKSNSDNNSAKQIKEETSKDCFDKSPKQSAEETNGKHFLNVPNLHTMSIHRSDNLPLGPTNKLTEAYESGSIKEPMITTDKNNRLFLSDDEKDMNIKKADSQGVMKNSSKKEMMSSKASRSNSQEFVETEKTKTNYRINQEKPGSDRRRSYEVDLLGLPQDNSDHRPRQRSWNELRCNSPLRENMVTLKVPNEVRSFQLE